MLYTQFNRDTRIELATMLSMGKNRSQCAKRLGMNKSSILREVRNNTDSDGVYRGANAHKKYLNRRKLAKQEYRKIENNTKLRRYIIGKIKQYWSPEQIAGRLNILKRETIICHETIYKFVYDKRPDLIKYLRHQKNKYRKRRGTHARIAFNTNSKIKRIEERPSVVETRQRLGDWEGDTVIGKEKTQRILTYVDRKSGFGMGDKLDVVSAEIVQEKTISLFSKLPKEKRLTLTRDNGSEFGDYDQTLERIMNMGVYRATPYHSWERGTNENWNGLLRQFFPKGMYFDKVTKDDVKYAVCMLNNRPRKRLGYKTPKEVFRDSCSSD